MEPAHSGGAARLRCVSRPSRRGRPVPATMGEFGAPRRTRRQTAGVFFTSASMSPSPDDRPRPDGSGEEPPPPPDAYADSRLDTFLTAFHRLSQAAAARAASEAAGGVGLVARVTDHLGVNPGTLPVVTEAVAPMRVVDIDVAVAHVVEAHGGGELVGVGGGDQRWHMSFADMLQENGWARLRVGAVEYRRESTGPDTERDIVAYGLHLFRHDGVPVALLQRGSNPQFGGEPKLEVVSPDADAVRRVLAEVREAMSTHSVLRGQVVVFTSSPFEPGSGGVSFLARPRIESGQIVLPDGLLARLRRHVIGIGERASELRALGQHLKRGVLLYGPPGTGKTLTVRHLVGESSSTVIVLTGAALANITLAARTARALAPSILVLEDCDLVAEERSTYTSSPLLFEVLDALDGARSRCGRHVPAHHQPRRRPRAGARPAAGAHRPRGGAAAAGRAGSPRPARGVRATPRSRRRGARVRGTGDDGYDGVARQGARPPGRAHGRGGGPSRGRRGPRGCCRGGDA